MAQYNADIIRKFASKLYTRANLIVIFYALIGALAGVALGELTWITFKSHLAVEHRISEQEASTIGGLFCMLLGAAYGQARAFWLRLQAQQALCQVQIEENTRALHQQPAVSSRREIQELVKG